MTGTGNSEARKNKQKYPFYSAQSYFFNNTKLGNMFSKKILKILKILKNAFLSPGWTKKESWYSETPGNDPKKLKTTGTSAN